MSSARPPVALIAGSDPEWDSRLEGARCDVYHTRGYHQFAFGSGEGEPFLIVVGDAERGLAWPYLLRSLEGIEGLEGVDGTDVTSVYGYPGPIGWGCKPEDPFLSAAWRAILDVWSDQRVISAFTRFNPLLGNAALAGKFRLRGAASGLMDHVSAGTPTVSIDCSVSDGAVTVGYSRVLRQEIAAARRAGLASEHDTTWAHLEAFVGLYGSTMSRRGAEERYLLTADDVRRFRATVAPYAHLLVTRLGSTIAAAGVFTEYKGIVQAHLVGTNDELRELSPLKVHLDDARHWAHKRDDRVLHLGGGRGGEDDTLLAFKGRFSPRRHAFHTGKWIVQREMYRELARRRAAAVGRDEATPFFPAYRAPPFPQQPNPAGHSE